MNAIIPIVTAVLCLLGAHGVVTAQDPAAGPGQEAPPGQGPLQDPASGFGPAMAWAHDDESLQWEACPDFLPEGCAIVVLNGDPAGDAADAFFKVPGGASIPRHRHTAAERMVLVSGALRVTYDGHDPVDLDTGMYAYGPAGLPHDGECAPGADCVLFISFDGPVDAFEVGPVGGDGGH